MATYKVTTQYEKQSRGTGSIRRVEPDVFEVWVTDAAVDREFQRLCQKYPEETPTRRDAEDSLAHTKLTAADTLGMLYSEGGGSDEPAPRGTGCSSCGRRSVMCRKAYDPIASETLRMGFPVSERAYCDDCRKAMFKKCGSCGKQLGNKETENEFCWVCQDEDLRPMRFARITNEKDPMEVLLTKIIRSGERRKNGSIANFALPPDHPDFAKSDATLWIKDLLPRLGETERIKRTEPAF